VAFRLVPTVHIHNGYRVIPSYGLFFEVDQTKVFLTTDAQFCPEAIGGFLDQADIIFHDCETAPYPSGVHAHYQQLLTLPQDIRNKMWLYHYQKGPLPDARGDGFLGFVQRGQTFDFANAQPGKTCPIGKNRTSM
jgi:hypothetical protein